MSCSPRHSPASSSWSASQSSSSRCRRRLAASSTAPPDIWVWRDAEVDPADPSREVSTASNRHLAETEGGAGDLGEDRHESLPDLDGGGLHRGSLGRERHPRLGVVVEPLREGEVLHADGVADTAPHG